MEATRKVRVPDGTTSALGFPNCRLLRHIGVSVAAPPVRRLFLLVPVFMSRRYNIDQRGRRVPCGRKRRSCGTLSARCGRRCAPAAGLFTQRLRRGEDDGAGQVVMRDGRALASMNAQHGPSPTGVS